MKTRQGFVSNSSSSSFIIRGSEVYPSIVEVAKAMIKIRDEDWERPTKIANKLAKYSKEVDFKKVGIFFSSCNYDTFIYEIDGYFFIKTCNNHPFHDAFSGQDYASVPDHITEKLAEIGIDGMDAVEYRTPAIDFLNLEADFIGREMVGHTYLCKEHTWTETWFMKMNDGDYIPFCPACKKEIKLDDQKDDIFKIRLSAGDGPSKSIEFLIKGRENVLKLKSHYPSYYIREEEFKIPTLTLEQAIEKLK